VLVVQSMPSSGDDEVASLARMIVTEREIEASWAPDATSEPRWIKLDSAGGVLTIEDDEHELTVGYFPVPVGEIRQVRLLLDRVELDGEDGTSAVLDDAPQLPSHTRSGWKWEPVEPLQVHEDERVGARALFSWDDHLSHNNGIGFQLRPTVPLERFDINPPEGEPGVYIDQLTLHLAPGTTAANVHAMNAGIGRGASVVYAPSLTNVWRIRLPVDVDPAVGADYYAGQAAVQAVWPAVNYGPDVIPLDAQDCDSSGANCHTRPNYTIAKIDRAWERGFVSSREVRVAVIDATGFDLDSPDLYENWSLNEGEIPASIQGSGCDPCFVDADANGRLDFADLNHPDNWAGAGAPCDDTVDLACDHNNNGVIDPQDLRQQSLWSVSADSWFNTVDEDGNGKPDDLVGWAFDSGGLPDVRDDIDVHGTQVISLLGGLHETEPGATGDGGIAGVAGRVSLLPLRANPVSASPGSTEPTTIGMPDQLFLEAVAYVEALNADSDPRNDVDIVLVSMGWSFSANRRGCRVLPKSERGQNTPLDASDFDSQLSAVLGSLPGTNFATGFGSTSPLYVLTAGNEGLDLSDGSAFHVPSGLFKATIDDRTLVVGGSTATLLGEDPGDYAIARGSNYGQADAVDVFAPFFSWKVMGPNGSLSTQSGTSLSAPAVAGTAALVMAAHEELSATEVRERLLGPGSLQDAPPHPCDAGDAHPNINQLFATSAL